MTLNFYRELIRMRRKYRALVDGSYTKHRANDHMLSYVREKNDETFLVVLNFCDTACEFDLGAFKGNIILSSNMQIEKKAVAGIINVRPNEGLLIKCQQ